LLKTRSLRTINKTKTKKDTAKINQYINQNITMMYVKMLIGVSGRCFKKFEVEKKKFEEYLNFLPSLEAEVKKELGLGLVGVYSVLRLSDFQKEKKM